MSTLTQLQENFPVTIKRKNLFIYALISLWMLSMIGLPIVKWVFGTDIIPLGVTLSAVLQAVTMFAIVQYSWGFKRTGIVFLVVAVLTWAAEAVGSRTGFPFGHYNYTEMLQPQIAHVPLLIPIAWFMMLPAAWAVAQLLVGKQDTLRKQIAFILVSASALTAWDLFLDPQMVDWGFWVWENPSGYFGIPWINYFGWLLTAAVVTIVVRPAALDPLPLLVVYGTVWFLQSFGQFFFWGQPGPAIVGFIVMGSFFVLATRKYIKAQIS